MSIFVAAMKYHMMTHCQHCSRSVEPSCADPSPICVLCLRIQALIDDLDGLRFAKHYEAADRMRDQLKDIGVEILNTRAGLSIWRWKRELAFADTTNS